jgi:hypothetical protein
MIPTLIIMALVIGLVAMAIVAIEAAECDCECHE